MILAKRTADYRKVLARHKHLSAVDLAVTRHHAVAGHTSLVQIKVIDARLQKAVHLHKGAGVKQHLNPLSRRQFPACVLLVNFALSAAEQSLLSSPVQFPVCLIPIHRAPPFI